MLDLGLSLGLGGVTGTALTELALGDFKNGVYRLDGELVTIDDVFEANEGFAFNKSTVINGSGLQDSNTQFPQATAELYALLDPLGLGFSAVFNMNVVSYLDATSEMYLYAALSQFPDFTDEWAVMVGFRPTAHASDSSVLLGDFSTNNTEFDAALNGTGRRRIAVSFCPLSGLSCSVNGRPVVRRAAEDLVELSPAFNLVYFYIYANQDAKGVGYVEDVTYYPMQAPTLLPGLSAL